MNKSNLKVVVLISGSGSNLQAIIDSIATNALPVDIMAVISNRPDAKGLSRAKMANIPAISLDHNAFESRDAFDQQLIQTINQYQPDLVILAGFMRILTDRFVTQFNDRIINIHPSLLPDFKGLNTHQRALDAKKKQHGVTIHYVNNQLDGGPLILQAIIDINDNDTVSSLQQRIHQQEHVIYPMVIKWIAMRRIKIINQHVYLDQQRLKGPAKWINNQLVI